MKLQILPVYVALLALLFSVLSIRTIRLRRTLKISVGDAGNQTMLRAMRVHSNFSEYVPICLILLIAMEARGGNALLIHALCIALLIGRVSHAFGVSQANENYRFRVFGMAMTLTTIIASSIYLLGSSMAQFGA